MGEKYDSLFKVIMLGDSNVGKTCIGSVMCNDVFLKDTRATIGVNITSQIITLPNEIVKIQIWDPAGQERYRAIIDAYYKGTTGVFMIYDITNRESFNNCVSFWYHKINRYADSKMVYFLIGNKNDLTDKREVSKEEGKREADRLGMKFFETSALTKENIKKAFENLAKLISKNHESEAKIKKDKKGPDNIKGEDIGKKKPKKSGCC